MVHDFVGSRKVGQEGWVVIDGGVAGSRDSVGV